MDSIGQEERPAMAVFEQALVRNCDLNRRSARSGNSVEADSQMPAGSKEDDAVLAPRAAATAGCVAEGLRRASSQTQLLQFSIGKEPERLPVRRPEGKAGAFGVGKAGRILRSRFIDPDCATPVGFPMPDNGYSMAIGRNSDIPRGEGEWSGKELGLWGHFRPAPPENKGDQQ